MSKEPKNPHQEDTTSSQNTAQPMQMQQPMQQQYGQPMMQQPMQQQPMQQQYSQPMMQQPTQYVVMQQSLKGVGGWLIFWLVCFSLAAMGYIWTFFFSMMALSSAIGVVGLIFSPILAGGYITSIVFIALQKKLAKLLVFITLGASAVYMIIMNIVVYATASSAVQAIDSYSRYSSSYSSSYSYSSAVSASLPILIAGIFVSLLGHSLVALYFFLSKRVKETLVN